MDDLFGFHVCLVLMDVFQQFNLLYATPCPPVKILGRSISISSED